MKFFVNTTRYPLLLTDGAAQVRADHERGGHGADPPGRGGAGQLQLQPGGLPRLVLGGLVLTPAGGPAVVRGPVLLSISVSIT